MRKSNALPFTLNFLKELRFNVIATFVRNNHEKFDLGSMLESPVSNRSSYYNDIRKDIFESTHEYLSQGTLHKLLFRIWKQDVDDSPISPFENATVELLEKYCQTRRPGINVKYPKINHQMLKGSKIIDIEFVLKIQTGDINDKKTEFYLGRGEDDLQWKGIIRSWAFKRPLTDIIKIHINENFKISSSVIAVIHGDSGCGKSLFLRKLSLDIISHKYTTIWVSDLKYFCDNDLDLLVKTDENFLLIFDDWYRFDNTDLVRIFLSRISDSTNLKLIIGDKNPIDKKNI